MRRFFIGKRRTCFVLFICLLIVVNHASFWQWLYPVHYIEEIQEAANEFGVDPFIIMAIVKNESAFRQESVSRRGAKGLMQLMPNTAEWVNELSGLNQQAHDYVTDPAANIFLGTWYISYLLEKYHGNVYLALAAYNAGQGNVDQWLQMDRWDGSRENIHHIPFGETRHYLKRIQFFYYQYKKVYGDQFET